MGKNRLRIVLVILALVLGAWYVYPTIRLVTLSDEQRAEMSADEIEKLKSKALRLGLDLEGGMHLVLEVDKSNLSEEEAEDAVDRALEIIQNRVDQFGVSEPSIQKQGQDRILVQLPGVQDAVRAKKLVGQTALLEFKLVRSSAEFTETLRRIDDFLYNRAEMSKPIAEAVEEETAETDKAAEIDTAADDLFAEETPKDDTFLKTPLTSRLSFLRSGEQDNAWVSLDMVSMVDSLINVPGVKGLVPFGAVFAWGMEPKDYGGHMMRPLYLMNEQAELTGTSISNAEVRTGLDQKRPNNPGVSLTLTGEGSHIFSRVTGNNVGRKLAIVLDSKVQSAPTIMDKIRHGSASITGDYSYEDAKDLRIVLRAGALPADLEFVEERTVGPSLGRDSIQMGLRAALIGGLVVVVFMMIYYRGAGVVANVALVLNLFFMMAVMAGLRATLTLPGIAGIILTIGMAVDANVLIFERIREELRNRKTVRAAIESGYSRAFRTILDANVTTLITAFVLLQFGTASVKGFAVTLSVGIVSSMFTALILTRLIFDFIVDRFAVQKLSI